MQLRFDTTEEAIAYCERHGIAYQVFEPKPHARRVISYCRQFRLQAPRALDALRLLTTNFWNAHMAAPAKAGTTAIIRKKSGLRHAAPEAAEEAGEDVRGQRGREPDAHHHREHARGGHLRDQREPDRREIKLAERGQHEIADQPQRARLAGAVHAAAAITTLASATQRQPNAILLIGAGSVPCRPCRAHSRTMSGVSTKIISGLRARNQGEGISPCQNREVDRAVGEILGPQQDRVALLVVGGPEQRHQRADADEREHGAALGRVERPRSRRRRLGVRQLIGGSVRAPQR